jgi:hypothetical protein
MLILTEKKAKLMLNETMFQHVRVLLGLQS